MANCGRQYATATLDSFRLHGSEDDQKRQADVLASIRRFCEGIGSSVGSGQCVLMLGPCGTGKDHLMIGMIREAIAAGVRDILWVDAAELFSQFKDAIAAQQNVGELRQSLVSPELLVISDMIPGSDPLTGFEADILFQCLNARGRRLKPTWVNANVANAAEMATKIPEKCVSRLDLNRFVVRTQWADFRRTAK